MHDGHTLESINVDQLATATDRLLLRGRLTKRRPPTRVPHFLAARLEPERRSRRDRSALRHRLLHAAILSTVFSFTALLITFV